MGIEEAEGTPERAVAVGWLETGSGWCSSEEPG